MKKLLLTVAVVSVLAGTAFACGDHAKALGDALVAGKSADDAVKALKDLKPGEVIGFSKKGADGKFTRTYNSASGGVVNEILSGDAEKNTKMMFDAVAGKKVGEIAEVTFTSSDGKNAAMKAQVMSAGSDTVAAVMWPADAKKEEAKPADAAASAVASAPAVEPKKEEAKPAAASAPVPTAAPASAAPKA